MNLNFIDYLDELCIDMITKQFIEIQFQQNIFALLPQTFPDFLIRPTNVKNGNFDDLMEVLVMFYITFL